MNRVCLVIFLALCFLCVWTPIVAMGDPVGGLSTGIRIEGAHTVSEGAYFRFWIVNYADWNVSVTINNQSTFILPKRSGHGSFLDQTNSNFTYNVIAPQVNLPFEKIHYYFKVNVTGVDYSSDSYLQANFPYTLDYPVYVLDSSIVSLLDYAIPTILIIAAVLIVVIIVLVRRAKKRSPRLLS